MTQMGVVERIDGRTVTVRCGTNPDCGSCESCLGSKKGHEFQAENRGGLALDVGDTVEVYVSPSKAIVASFVVFILPLFLFFALYGVAPVVGIESEIGKVVAGLSGIALGFGFNYAVRASDKNQNLPEIRSVKTVE